MIASDGNASVTSRGICWGLNTNPTISDSKTNDGTGEGQFVSSLTGLTAGSTYHVRAYATNSVGTAYGADLSFATLGMAPECLTQAATNITSSGATLNGKVNANHLSTNVTFEYGIVSSYGSTVTANQSPLTGNNITNVNADISGLTPGTKYHYRVSSVNSLGTTIGNDLTFDTEQSIPILTTLPTLNKTSNSVTTGGNITSDGGAAITSKGVCYSTTPYPTVTNNKTINGSGTGSFISKLTCLSDQTTYYVRAYATNSIGTAYGDQLSFTTEKKTITFNPNFTYGSVKDIDDNCYKTIQIGDEIWMAENLKTSRYNDGIPIPNVTDNTEWEKLLSSISTPPYITTGAYCWYNNDSATYENVYGKLYNYGVVNSSKICPVGWHIPAGIDYLEKSFISGDCYLDSYLGGTLMETGSIHWINPYSACINNETGFSAIPAGKRNSDGTFTEFGYHAYFWVTGVIGHGPLVMNQKVPHSPTYCHSPTSCGILPTQGHSIRCVKD